MRQRTEPFRLNCTIHSCRIISCSMPRTGQTRSVYSCNFPAYRNRALSAWVFAPMPRFFFHVRERDKLFEDEEGQELPDVEAAELEAAQSAAEISREVLPSRRGGG